MTSRFVGRKRELAELRRLLRHTRLLTLVGPGGVGKTRIAMELARQATARYPGPVAVAELADVDDPGLLVEAIARGAALRLEGPEAGDALARALGAHGLLVIDNCEHLVEAVAALVSSLLAACPTLRIIATSRERLNIGAEMTWVAPPLALPDSTAGPEAVAASEAAELFVDRARMARPGFCLDPSNAADVAAVCRRLDGIPLAIELAASRSGTLTPADLLPMLEHSLALLGSGPRDAPTRQQTLRATIEWSYRLLAPPQQVLLQRLSVFAGVFDAEAVTEVCAGAPLPPAEVPAVLAALVDRSMVQAEHQGSHARYRVLQVIREYAATELSAGGGEVAVRDHHLARYLRLSREVFNAIRARGVDAERRRVWDQMSDVRLALAWARRDPDLELEMLGNLYLVWITGAPMEGFERVTEAIRRARPSTSDAFLRAGYAWNALGGITGRNAAFRSGEGFVADEDHLLELLGPDGDPFLAGSLSVGRGYRLEREVGDLEAARDTMVAGIAILARLGASPAAAMAMGSLGSVEARLGRLAEGRAWIDRAVTMAQEVDDAYGTVGAYFHLGYFELDHGSREAAVAAFVAGLKLVDPDDSISIADQVGGVACAIADSDPAGALRLLGATIRLRGVVGPTAAEPWVPRQLEAVAEARGKLEAAAADDAWRSGDGLSARALMDEVLRSFASPPAPRRRAGSSPGPGRPGGISQREMEVAELVASGLTSRAIAARLFLSERTVETHLTRIMTRLGVNSRAQVAAWFAEEASRGA